MCPFSVSPSSSPLLTSIKIMPETPPLLIVHDQLTFISKSRKHDAFPKKPQHATNHEREEGCRCREFSFAHGFGREPGRQVRCAVPSWLAGVRGSVGRASDDGQLLVSPHPLPVGDKPENKQLTRLGASSRHMALSCHIIKTILCLKRAIFS